MLEHNGKIYARVSDILRPYVDFSSIPEEVLQRKAALGTRIHHAIDEEINGGFPVVSLNELGYFQSFECWRSVIEPVFIETEKRIYDDAKMITGCLDALVKIQGEKECILVDWKTSVSESPTWVMQAHLYYYLLKSQGYEVAPRFLFIKLDKKGKAPTIYEYPFDKKRYKGCLDAVDEFWKNVAINPQ